MIGQKYGQSMELFFVEGRSDGMVTATIFNWTGHVLAASRAQVFDALRRPEAARTGVYLLFGEDDAGKPIAYIGEGEDISERIRNHHALKDWWSRMVLITSSEDVLNKAHAKYLESRLVERAKVVGKVRLDNTATPKLPSMNEPAKANMENFLEYLHVLLPALRIDCFVSETRPAIDLITPATTATTVAASLRTTGIFELNTPLHGLHAEALLVGGEFVVQAGSLARAEWMGESSKDSSYARLHAELRRMGVLVPQGDHCVFSESYAFSSPSAAGAVVNGRPTQGPEAWKERGTGRTYKDWEAARLADGERIDDVAQNESMHAEEISSED